MYPLALAALDGRYRDDAERRQRLAQYYQSKASLALMKSVGR